jgi:N-acetylmuramoyl-L-alanine amidase
VAIGFSFPKFAIRLVILLVLLGSASGAHTVRKGDTLYSIAQANGVSVEKLMQVNGIRNANRLQVGKRLTIPGKGQTAESPRSVAVKASRKSGSTTSVTKSLTVIIDPGHGGRDRGAVWGGIRESDLNLKTAYKVKYYLEKAGYRTVMTRGSDRYVSLSKRAAIANRYRHAIFVSIHYNATRETWVRGAETFHGGSRQSRYLASSVQRQLASNCEVRNRGSHLGRYSVLRKTRCPAILSECGFISNSGERSRCNSNAFQDAAARAIFSGIQRYDRTY